MRWERAVGRRTVRDGEGVAEGRKGTTNPPQQQAVSVCLVFSRGPLQPLSNIQEFLTVPSRVPFRFVLELELEEEQWRKLPGSELTPTSYER